MGRTAENPAVGCVLVKAGKIIAEGATQDGGRPHAERVALDRATEPTRGATAYVTLEPCAHFGQTPPCVDALIKAGIIRCVIATVDPDVRVNYLGIKRLKQARIAVSVGEGEARAREIMSDFFSRTLGCGR